MFILSKRQLESVDASTRKAFLQRLVTLSTDLKPELAERLSTDQLLDFAETAWTEAEALGFSTEFEISVFCAGIVLEGEGFHVNSANPLHEVVNRTDTEPHLRAVQLLYELEKTSEMELDLKESHGQR